MRYLGILTIVLALLLAACSTPAEDAVTPNPGEASADLIEGQYIIVLKDEGLEVQSEDVFAARVDGVALELGVDLLQPLRIINGFSAKFNESQLAAVENDAKVAYVEQDQLMYATVTQNNATWGLDRIDSTNRNGTYVYNSTGAGVNAYIMDTGIRSAHAEFGGRVRSGATAIQDGRGTEDCNGHGTHVAGTVGGRTFGVAKNVNLIPVRVLGCNGSGSNSGIIAAVNWVTNNHVKPAVANMSLGGGASQALDAAVNNSSRAGVTYAVAAGNSRTDACSASPARAGSAITVGASNINDQRASFSNFGRCVDIFAPGQNITAAWINGNSSTNTISGTSMASPHVAGVVALILERNPNVGPTPIINYLNDTSLKNRISDVRGSPNRLLFKGTR